MPLLTRVDRYLARLIALPLLSTLTIAAMLLLLDRMLRLFDFVMNEGGPVSVVWRMLGNLLPEYLSLGIPIGVMLGILLAFRGLAASSELDALRAVGIPARYVSGYLQSKPDAAIGETIVGESHAWVEWFTGDWFGYDPTNMLNIGERHVLIARGRDYKDVSPLRGVYAGASASGVFVKVEITKEA